MFREFVGALAVLLSLAGLVPYLYDSWRGRTRPHMFTWLIWTVMTFIAFAAQVVGNGGPGAWATGVTAVLCVPVFFLSIRGGNHDVRLLDWISLFVAIVAGLVWMATDDPTMSVILITVIDAVAFVPTIRKSIHKPHQETTLNYMTSMSKHFLSIAALSKVSIVTALYPAVVGLMNLVMILLLTVRRKQVRPAAIPHQLRDPEPELL